MIVKFNNLVLNRKRKKEESIASISEVNSNNINGINSMQNNLNTTVYEEKHINKNLNFDHNSIDAPQQEVNKNDKTELPKTQKEVKFSLFEVRIL